MLLRVLTAGPQLSKHYCAQRHSDLHQNLKPQNTPNANEAKVTVFDPSFVLAKGVEVRVFSYKCMIP
jgi:hypothetical protein